MEDPEKEARQIYNKIGRIWCAELNDHISFNSIGFRHLIWKGKARRPYSQKIKRLSLIPYAVDAITQPSQPVTKRYKKGYSSVTRDGMKIMIHTHVRFWAFSTSANERTIRVIVRQANNGDKHFFSIFEEEK